MHNCEEGQARVSLCAIERACHSSLARKAFELAPRRGTHQMDADGGFGLRQELSRCVRPCGSHLTPKHLQRRKRWEACFRKLESQRRGISDSDAKTCETMADISDLPSAAASVPLGDHLFLPRLWWHSAWRFEPRRLPRVWYDERHLWYCYRDSQQAEGEAPLVRRRRRSVAICRRDVPKVCTPGAELQNCSVAVSRRRRHHFLQMSQVWLHLQCEQLNGRTVSNALPASRTSFANAWCRTDLCLGRL